MTNKSKLLNKDIKIEAIEPEHIYILQGVAPLYHPSYADGKKIISQDNIENGLEQELVETINKLQELYSMPLIRAPNAKNLLHT